jgi:hypothetical protein
MTNDLLGRVTGVHAVPGPTPHGLFSVDIRSGLESRLWLVTPICHVTVGQHSGLLSTHHSSAWQPSSPRVN